MIRQICQQYLKKGGKVYFEGRLKTRNWEDPDGKKNYRTEIVAENMIMLDSRGAGSTAPAATGQPAAASSPSSEAQQKAPPPTEEEVKIDDLPF